MAGGLGRFEGRRRSRESRKWNGRQDHDAYIRWSAPHRRYGGGTGSSDCKSGSPHLPQRHPQPGVASSHHIIGRGAAQPELQTLQPHALDTVTFTPYYYYYY